MSRRLSPGRWVDEKEYYRTGTSDFANGAEEAAGPPSKYCDKTETEGVGV